MKAEWNKAGIAPWNKQVSENNVLFASVRIGDRLKCPFTQLQCKLNLTADKQHTIIGYNAAYHKGYLQIIKSLVSLIWIICLELTGSKAVLLND